jgi:short-subunit dehydrogenase
MRDAAFVERYGAVALVTGASSGIGAAFAKQLAAKGMDLVVVARRRQRLDELAASLQAQHGVKVTVCEADLGDASAATQIAQVCAGLDVGLLVSNAGFGLKGAFDNGDPAVLAGMLMVNCHTPLLLAREFVPRLRQRGKGGLLFTSSVEGLIACPYSTTYAATKAFVNSLGEGLWAELTPQGISVLSLCPGATDTEAPRLQGIDPATLRNLMSAEEVATLALQNLDNGPVYIPSDHYRASFERLLAMPRRDALKAMAASMKP